MCEIWGEYCTLYIAPTQHLREYLIGLLRRYLSIEKSPTSLALLVASTRRRIRYVQELNTKHAIAGQTLPECMYYIGI